MYSLDMSPCSFEAYLAHSLHAWAGRGLRAYDLPNHLQQALHHAVFGGGGRVRPRLCLAVASAYGAADHPVVRASAVALEFLHSASLVHDDLPCFDAADTRRGKPSVQRAFGEATAVLTGDSLIMASFAVLARVSRHYPQRAGRAMREIARAGRHLVAGQASEACDTLDLAVYHRQKTGALFEAATICGAIAAGASPRGWRDVGRQVGLAYQLADDITDARIDHNQPNIVRMGHVTEPRKRLQHLLGQARAAVPATLRPPLAIEHWFDGLTRQLTAA